MVHARHVYIIRSLRQAVERGEETELAASDSRGAWNWRRSELRDGPGIREWIWGLPLEADLIFGGRTPALNPPSAGVSKSTRQVRKSDIPPSPVADPGAVGAFGDRGEAPAFSCAICAALVTIRMFFSRAAGGGGVSRDASRRCISARWDSQRSHWDPPRCWCFRSLGPRGLRKAPGPDAASVEPMPRLCPPPGLPGRAAEWRCCMMC